MFQVRQKNERRCIPMEQQPLLVIMPEDEGQIENPRLQQILQYATEGKPLEIWH